MQKSRMSLRAEHGDASILLALFLALGLGTAVCYNMDKVNQSRSVHSIQSQRERAETRNLSGLSQATALMQFTGLNPKSNDASALPYIYPDPYIDNIDIGAVRPVANANTCSFSAMTLNVRSLVDDQLSREGFVNYVKGGSRPELSNKSTIRFIAPIKDALHPDFIQGYTAEVTTTTKEGKSLTQRASVDVPAVLAPECELTSADGQSDYQPNTPMTLVLNVSGVAVSARIPDTTEALIEGFPSFGLHKIVDLRGKANSIRKLNSAVYNWQVTTPRPLVAVDGTSMASYTTYAYLKAVDNNSENNISCSFTYRVTAPATCKLWTDQASVAPGSCVDITSETVGSVQAGSLKLSVTDTAGKKVSGLNQTSATGGTFCAPANASTSGVASVAVDQSTADKYDKALKGLLPEQTKAIMDAMNTLAKQLKAAFPLAVSLHQLTANQVNALLNLSPSQLAALDQVDFKKIQDLKDLSSKQIDAIVALTASEVQTMLGLPTTDLPGIKILQSVKDPAPLLALQDEEPAMLASHIASILKAAAAPSDYKILGSIKAADGTTNFCAVHVTAGSNKCPFFGSGFPNVSQNMTLPIVSNGVASSLNFDFTPAKPSWEVEGIATSPSNVDKCPVGARCFAVGGFGNRTPFVIVEPADSASCKATVNMRIDLGCFDYDTQIRMADGTEKAIHLLKDGDRVYNPIRKEAMAIKRVIAGPEKFPLLVIQTGSGEVKVTRAHPMITKEGLKRADAIQVGDQIAAQSGTWEAVNAVSVEADRPRQTVWNFVIDTASQDPSDHAILANGVITGDLYLQEYLAHRKSLAAQGH